MIANIKQLQIINLIIFDYYPVFILGYSHKETKLGLTGLFLF